MTKLDSNHPLIRETALSERGRPILVELHPGFLILRLKGKRDRYSVPYDAVLWLAIKGEAERRKAEKNRR